MGLADYVQHYIPSMRAVVIFFFTVYVPLFIISLTFFGRRSRKTPFSVVTLTKEPPEKLTTDRRLRDAVLRRHFNTKRIPNRVDVIVVGSNLSGMVTAGLLARSGLRVLVLERSSVVGGEQIVNEPSHNAEAELSKHFANMKKTCALRVLMDQLTNNALKWAEIEPNFDSVYLCHGEQQSRRVAICAGYDTFKSELYKHFPEEEQAINAYFNLLSKMQRSLWHTFWIKLLPINFCNLLDKIGIFSYFSNFFIIGNRLVTDVLDELTTNEDLKIVLTYYCHLFKQSPSNTTFASYSFQMNQMLQNGASYPVGGQSEIAFNIVPLIESARGKVLVSAPIEKLLCNERRVTGVQVAFGQKLVDIPARTVIIADGVCQIRQLLSNQMTEKMEWLDEIRQPDNAPLNMSFQIWLDEDVSTCQLRSQNSYFIHSDKTKSYARLMVDWLLLSAKEASCQLPPCFMMACPSAKDPGWIERHGKDTSVVVVSFAGSRQWLDDLQVRGEVREQFFSTIWEKVCLLQPHLKDMTIRKTDFFFDQDSKLTDDASRYEVNMQARLRPLTGIRSLLLTGSDLVAEGMMGELYGALLCASYYLNRNLMSELAQIARRVEKEKCV